MQTLKRKLFHLIWAIVLIYTPLYIISAVKNAAPPPAVSYVRTSKPKPAPLRDQTGPSPFQGRLSLMVPPFKDDIRVPEKFREEGYRYKGLGFRSHSVQGRRVTLIAFGQNLQPYFANGFFKGFIPFQTTSKWVPMRHIAREMRYEPDTVQFPGYTDIWLSSEEAYLRKRGDCEDHAILLADWLVGMGYDARVAIGSIKDEGHAWVVLFEEGKTYLLEATSGYEHHRFPLASLLPQYHPIGMFNDRFIWYNYGSSLTTDYSDAKWVKTARFERFR